MFRQRAVGAARVGFIGLLLVLASCATDSSSGGSAVIDSTTTPGDSVPAAVDGFTAPLVGGGEFSLTNELSSKPVALWFWAPG